MADYNYPKRIPFYKFLLHSKTISKNPIPFHEECFDGSDGNFSIKPVFGPNVMLTKNAEITQQILRKNHKNYHKSKLQTHYLSKYVGYGLLTSSGDYWLKQRRLIQPAFHKQKIQNLLEIIDRTIEEQVDKIKKDAFYPLYPIMNTLAFEVVAKSLFNFNADKDTLKRLQLIVEQLQRFIIKEIREPHKRFMYILSGEKKRHSKLVIESRQIINALIEKRRESKEDHDDLLDMLLNAEYEDGSKMTNKQLIDEILILFVAGHETTANALSFTLFLLANNLEALKKAKEEVEQVGVEDTLTDRIGKLPYITNCVNEAMRLYPPAWITDRVALEDDLLGDYHIRKGTLIGVSIYELHRNPLYWQDAEAFIPERFESIDKKRLSEIFLPFGAGPRLCIGNNFAMSEMILTVYAVVKKFRIEAQSNAIKVNPLITLKPVGLELKFKNR